MLRTAAGRTPVQLQTGQSSLRAAMTVRVQCRALGRGATGASAVWLALGESSLEISLWSRRPRTVGRHARCRHDRRNPATRRLVRLWIVSETGVRGRHALLAVTVGRGLADSRCTWTSSTVAKLVMLAMERWLCKVATLNRVRWTAKVDGQLGATVLQHVGVGPARRCTR